MTGQAVPVRIAYIGAGIFTRDTHLPALAALGDTFEVVAVYSRTRESAVQMAGMLPGEVEIHRDMGTMLARLSHDDIDAVSITLPIPMLPDAVEQVLEAGKHVFSEKPVATTVARGRRLLDVHASHPDQVWMVGENYRYEEPFVRAGEIVASGEIGRVHMADWAIYVPFTPDNKYFKTQWRRNVLYPGGMLMDGGVHHIAGWRMVLGEVAAVNAMATLRRADLPPLDTLSASMEFDSGAVGAYSVTYAAGAPWWGSLQIVGENGALRVSRGDPLEVTVAGQTRQIPVETFKGVEREFAAFAAAIRAGTPHRNTPDQALQDVAVLEAILQAAESGQRVVPERVVGQR